MIDKAIPLREHTHMTSALRGGGGVGPKADRVIQLSKGGCVNLRTRGGGGTKIPKFCGRHMCMAPNAEREK